MNVKAVLYAPFVILAIVFVLGLYFLPSVLAFSKAYPQRTVILLINLVLGWTIFVWILLTLYALALPNYQGQINPYADDHVWDTICDRAAEKLADKQFAERTRREATGEATSDDRPF